MAALERDGPVRTIIGVNMTEKLAYSVSEACVAIGLGRTRLYEEIKAGNIPVRKVGKRTLIPVAGVHAFLKGETTHE